MEDGNKCIFFDMGFSEYVGTSSLTNKRVKLKAGST